MLHGPLALVGPGFPALALDPGDEGSESVRAAAKAFSGLGADLRYAGTDSGAGQSLPLPLDLPAALLPLALQNGVPDVPVQKHHGRIGCHGDPQPF